MANFVAARATSYVATVVAITTESLLDDTSAALQTLRDQSAVRTILITLGDAPQPAVDRSVEATVIRGLVPAFVNNAVAALRLSSLPTLAWWQRAEARLLEDIAHLVDRIVLDVPDPDACWKEARRLRDLSSFSDLRWTRLTRWRSLMAQFFDLPDIRAAGASFTTLDVAAADPDAARLFGAWMQSRLPGGRELRISITPSDSARGALTSVTLRGGSHQLGLKVRPNNMCVETVVTRDGQPDTVRIVPLGNLTPVSLLSQEMRVRARDVAFEDALEGVATI